MADFKRKHPDELAKRLQEHHQYAAREELHRKLMYRDWWLAQVNDGGSASSAAAVVPAVPIPAPSLFAADGIWTWYNDPRAVYDSRYNCTYVGAVSSTGNQMLFRYHHDSGYLQTFDWNAGWGIDDHENPGIILNAAGGPLAGQITLCSTSHGVSNYYGNSLTPGGASSFLLGSTFLTPQNRSYALVCQMTDTAQTIYWFARDQSNVSVPSAGFFNAPHFFQTSTDGGKTWTAEQQFFANIGQRPYVNFYPSGNRVDFVTTNAGLSDLNANPISLYHFYMTIAANGTRSWFKSDGTQIGSGDSALPLGTSNVTLVYDGTPANALAWDICSIGGTLSILYAVFTTTTLTFDTHTYYRATLAGGVWTSEKICDGGPHLPNWLYSGEVSYSGGLCCDQNDINTVYVSRCYGAADFRIERWQRGAPNSWSKTADISGATGTINARPTWCRGANPTRIFYWSGSYTSYNIFNTALYVWPPLPINIYTVAQKTKPASPVWRSTLAPAGVNGYWPLTDGAGTTVTDYFTSPHNGAFVGAPAWHTGSFGPELNTFTTSNYVAINPASQLLGTGSYPFWMAMLFKNTGTTDSYPFSQGSSGSNVPYIALEGNNTAGKVGLDVRSDDNTEFEVAVTANINDGNYHVWMVVVWSSTYAGVYFDGVQVTTAAQGTLTTWTANNKLALGVLLRAAASNAWTGTIVAASCGSGAAPDPQDFADDWLSGQFAAIR